MTSSEQTPCRDGTGITAVARVPLPRLYLLRTGYLILGAGLAMTRWPAFIQRDPPSFTDVVDDVTAFADPALSGALTGAASWDATRRTWIT